MVSGGGSFFSQFIQTMSSEKTTLEQAMLGSAGHVVRTLMEEDLGAAARLRATSKALRAASMCPQTLRHIRDAITDSWYRCFRATQGSAKGAVILATRFHRPVVDKASKKQRLHALTFCSVRLPRGLTALDDAKEPCEVEIVRAEDRNNYRACVPANEAGWHNVVWTPHRFLTALTAIDRACGRTLAAAGTSDDMRLHLLGEVQRRTQAKVAQLRSWGVR